ncbi:hypothetical protein NQZ68_020358 [Dissostichus eleginoides]|nr:hypothetical protein NQZ68_020358 [Dissostichus eleginoides]
MAQRSQILKQGLGAGGGGSRAQRFFPAPHPWESCRSLTSPSPPLGQTQPAKSSNRREYSWNAPLSSLPSTWESVPAVDSLACHQAQIAPLDPDQLPPAPAIPMVPMDPRLAETPSTLQLAQIATYKTKLLECVSKTCSH